MCTFKQSKLSNGFCEIWLEVETIMIEPLNTLGNQRGYIPYLDGLRAFSVFLVMLSHFQYSHIIPGGFGVTVFFVISGFIITRVLFLSCEGNVQNINIVNFYLRRFFRLAPALFCFTVAMLLTDLVTGYPINWWEYFAVTIYQHNYAVHLFNMNEHRYFGHLWSLAVEEHFYLIFPLILALLSFKASKVKFFVMMCFAIVLWRVVLVYFANESPIPILSSEHVYRRSDTRFDAILYGVILALLSIHHSVLINAIKKNGLIVFLSGIFVAVIPSVFNVDPQFKLSFGLALEGIGIAFSLASLLFSEMLSPVRAVLSLPIFVWCGKISYSLYIWHVAVYWRLIDSLSISNDLVRLLIGILASIFFAALSYYFIENPIRKFGRKITERRSKKFSHNTSVV